MSVQIVEMEKPAFSIDRPMTEVLILGAGISGMLAAWACEQRDRSFTIVDKGPEEDLPRLVKGCVYLHEPCGLEDHLRQQQLFTSIVPYPSAGARQWSEIYHQKIWGDAVQYEPNSIDKFGTRNPWRTIWSMNDALDHLYRRYRDYIEYEAVTWDMVKRSLDFGYKVISTLPVGALFPDTPRMSKPLWVVQMKADEGKGRHAYTLYNVDPNVGWYRMTSMFGATSIEFCQEPLYVKSYQFQKIMGTGLAELDGLHPNLLFVGRWARWQRGFLSHMAYRAVCEKFDSGAWR